MGRPCLPVVPYRTRVEDGRLIEDFWGHICLPEYLSGDLKLVNLPERQEVGGTETGGTRFRLKAVRWEGHPGVFRLVFELEAVGSTSASVSPALASHYSRSSRVLHVVLEGTEAAGVESLEEGAFTRIGDWWAFSLVWEKEEPGVASLAMALEPARNYGWRASALSDPCRAVMGVFSCGR